MNDTSHRDVRALVQRERSGVLSSAHAAHDGWPFASTVPYAITDDGDLVVFLSDIAEHTRNLANEPRATLLVADPAAREAPQAGARHAAMVRAVRPTGAGAEAAERCYFERFPEAQSMRQSHGFAAWVLMVERVRWIAGYGAMGWMDRAAWQQAGRGEG